MNGVMTQEERRQRDVDLNRETVTTLEVEELVETELKRIAEIIERHPDEKLQTLVHLINKETLKYCHQTMDKKKATGIDGISKEEYSVNLEENLENLVLRMKRQAYKPQPVRRAFIPKDEKNLRPLGIPSYEDKLVQMAMSKIMNEIYETEFKDFSYGFRPNRSCHDALKALNMTLETKKVCYVVDADIKGFFDNVDHKWMIKFLEHRIGDPNFIRLVYRFLRAGIMEDGKYQESDKGTPQGGNMSPILANVYLHYVLDLWFDVAVKKGSRGEAYLTRYADDFVACFQYKEDAYTFYQALKERLGEFGLELSESKTRIIEFGRFAEENRDKRGDGKPETFDFLGFTHYCSKSVNGKYRVKRKTSRKKLKNKLRAAKTWLRKNMQMSVIHLIGKLNTKLIGHYRYYGITDNSKMLDNFRYRVIKMMFKVLNRRSQRKSYNKDKFEQLLKKYPIVKPKIYVNIYG